jgi:solute carrier family 35 (UDP-sugar transporter), member A1/2/3
MSSSSSLLAAVSGLSTAAIACISLALLTSSQNVLITWSKRNGAYEYNYVSVTMLTELLKLSVSLYLLYREQLVRREQESRDMQRGLLADAAAPDDSSSGELTEKAGGGGGVASSGNAPSRVPKVDIAYELSYRGFVDRLPFALPAALYFLKNNLVFYGLLQSDPVQFQLLGNLKILTTTLLFRLIMKKPLSDLAYTSLLLLTIGLTMTQLKNDTQLALTLDAVLTQVVIATLSGLAAIVTEWLMKSNPRRQYESLHIQNIWLYVYGIVFNLLALIGDDYEALWRDGFFYGYSWVTIFIICNNAWSGIAVSAIMKYANNLVKLFVFAVSLVVTTVLSIVFFSFEPSLHFALGSSVVFIAIYLYNRKD